MHPFPCPEQMSTAHRRALRTQHCLWSAELLRHRLVMDPGLEPGTREACMLKHGDRRSEVVSGDAFWLFNAAALPTELIHRVLGDRCRSSPFP